MEHGGILADYGNPEKDIIDFSSNINPLGYPHGVREAITDSIDTLTRYPDFRNRRVKLNVAEYLGVDPKQVSVGNGSMEIIDLIISLFDEVILFEPCFSEYGIRARVRNKNILTEAFANDFAFDLNKLINKKDACVVLGNPNNPTGRRLKESAIRELYDISLKNNLYLVLDEAFFEFCDNDYDSINIFRENNFNNVSVIRAATKFFGLPGLRFGYSVSSNVISEEINKAQISWPLNSFVEPVSDIIFKDKDFFLRSKMFMKEERKNLKEKYEKFKHFKFLDTQANFYLVNLLGTTADFVFEELLKVNILCRKTDSFSNLDGEYIRFAIKSHEDNKVLLKELKIIDENLR